MYKTTFFLTDCMYRDYSLLIIMNLSLDIVNHILSFRPTHPVAVLIKQSVLDIEKRFYPCYPFYYILLLNNNKWGSIIERQKQYILYWNARIF